MIGWKTALEAADHPSCAYSRQRGHGHPLVSPELALVDETFLIKLLKCNTLFLFLSVYLS